MTQNSNPEKINSIIDTRVEYSLAKHKCKTTSKRNYKIQKIQDMESFIEVCESVFNKSAQYIK